MTELTLGRARWNAEHRFYTSMALAIFVVVYVGFAPTFFLRPWLGDLRPSPPEPFFYFHGAVFTAWFLLLVLQPTLVGLGRTDVHRALGKLGAAIAASMVVVGLMGAVIAARRPDGFVGIPVPAAQFMLIPVMDMLLFGVLVALAVAFRRDTQAHKRLMLVASIAIVPAAVARWPLVRDTGNPLVFFALTDLLLVPLVLWDLRSRGRLHAVTLWAGSWLVASQPLRLWLMGTGAWLAVAAWLI